MVCAQQGSPDSLVSDMQCPPPARAESTRSHTWVNDIQSLFGYSLVASLFITYEVSGWTAFSALIAAGLMVMVRVNLSGRPGVDYGIPYAVLARASMGTSGAKLPAVLRAVVAVFWYGLQTYFVSTALALLINTVAGSTGGGAEYLGLSTIDWLSSSTMTPPACVPGQGNPALSDATTGAIDHSGNACSISLLMSVTRCVAALTALTYS